MNGIIVLAKSCFKNPVTLWLNWLFCNFRNQIRYSGRRLSVKYMAMVSDCQFGVQNTIYEYAELFKVSVGDYSYIGPRSRLSNTRVGKFVCIGPDVIVGPGIHPSRDFVTTHPAFFSIERQAGFSFVEKIQFNEHEECNIGNDVWVGARAIILNGISIGDGAIIGAGAVVTKDVPDYAVVGGVPAKVLRFRFSSEEIEQLKLIRWWEKDFDWIKDNSVLFRDISSFLKELSKSLEDA